MAAVRRRKYPKREPMLDAPPNPAKERLYDIGWIIGCVAVWLFCVWFVVVAMPGTVREAQQGDHIIISFSGMGYLTILAIGGGMIGTALKFGFDKQLHHWALVATGGVFIIFMLLYAAMERVEITPQGFSIRSLVGACVNLNFADLESLGEVKEPRKPWARATSPQPSKLVIRRKNQAEDETIFASRYPSTLYTKASMKLLFQWSMFRLKERMDALPEGSRVLPG